MWATLRITEYLIGQALQAGAAVVAVLAVVYLATGH